MKTTEKKISDLMSLVDTRRKSKTKIDILNQLEVINGYDLVFILSLITRNNFSGNLTIVNEDNLLSGITFIYGDIVKVDYPDQEHLLGNLIVDHEILSKFELQEIVEKSGGVRLGDYLVDNNHITQQQLRKLLFNQSTLRLTKYLSSISIRVKFTFDGESNDNVLINKIDYLDILHKWIFENFEDSWLEEYVGYYQKASYSSDIGTENFQFLKDYPDAYDVAFKISQLRKPSFSYNEIFKVAHKTRQKFFRILHFMILSGALYLVKSMEFAPVVEDSGLVKAELLVENLGADLLTIQKNLLDKKYFQAFGLLNKYSNYNHTHPTVTFYFIWIKLIGAYYNNHKIDIKKITQDFISADYQKVNAGEYFYVKSLLLAIQKKFDESDESYQYAIKQNAIYKNFPIKRENESAVGKLLSSIFGKK